MAITTASLTCPSCGAKISLDKEECEYCGSTLIFSEFNSIFSMGDSYVGKCINAYSQAIEHLYSPELMFSAGMCYLKIRLFDKAFQCFEKAIVSSFNNPDIYFFSALSLLNGKKPFFSKRETIDKIETLINTALSIEPKGIYYYFWGYIKYDYFERKFLKTTPDYRECLNNAVGHHATDLDKKMLFDIIGIERPTGF